MEEKDLPELLFIGDVATTLHVSDTSVDKLFAGRMRTKSGAAYVPPPAKIGTVAARYIATDDLVAFIRHYSPFSGVLDCLAGTWSTRDLKEHIYKRTGERVASAVAVVDGYIALYRQRLRLPPLWRWQWGDVEQAAAPAIAVQGQPTGRKGGKTSQIAMPMFLRSVAEAAAAAYMRGEFRLYANYEGRPLRLFVATKYTYAKKKKQK
ncbi:MAG: hypothetical protein J6P03_03370 [Opitutales bacterium]|nr:hypothetical protein [Opitutales bacterium]